MDQPENFPRSANYDLDWMVENQMGPNVIWLAESLSQAMDLKPGMRVLDMGCGRASSSIFFAREFDVQVWAVDLWVKATDNWNRIRAAGLEEQIFPIHAEARDLPFANDFFDAIVSLDAYHYFGTDDLYLKYFLKFLKPGNQVGMIVPGLRNEFSGDLPPHLKPYWVPDLYSLHSPAWWRRHWERSGKVEIEIADMLPDGWKLWRSWMELLFEKEGQAYAERETHMLEKDAGRNLGFTRLVARKLGA